MFVDCRLRWQENVSPAEEDLVKGFPQSRGTPSNLSDSIHQQLNMYAVMASAAGVGMLALSHPSEAKIVYPPAHTLIDSGQTVPLDLNRDGKADFSFQNYSNTSEGSEQGFLTVITAQAKNSVDGEAVYDRALALKAGTRVGPKARFISLHSISKVSADAAERCFGNCSNAKNRYLGLRFVRLPNVWGTAEATGVGALNALPAQQSNGVGDLERLFSAVPTPTRSGLVIGLDPARNSILESIFTCSTQMPPSDATVLGMT
jgi:hypothetical protein